MPRVTVSVVVEEVRCTAKGCEASAVPDPTTIERMPARVGFVLRARSTTAPDGWTYLRVAGRVGDLCPDCTRKAVRALKAAGVLA